MLPNHCSKDFVGDPIYRSWSKEIPLWWILYRTEVPGAFNANDAKQFKLYTGRYIILLDHAYDAKARELATYLIDRFDYFGAAKVSKFARDGEKVLTLLAKDNSMQDALSSFVQQWGMQVIAFKGQDDLVSHEKMANQKWGLYLARLARAFQPP